MIFLPRQKISRKKGISAKFSLAVKMLSPLNLFWFLSTLLATAWSCRQNGYSLIQHKITNQTALTCSKTIHVSSTYTKLITLTSQDNVAAIYIRYGQGGSTAQLCYWRVVGIDYVSAASLSGGHIYMLGKPG